MVLSAPDYPGQVSAIREMDRAQSSEGRNAMQTATPIPVVFPRETHVLLYLAKWALRAVFLLGVTLTLASRAAAAPVVFQVSGGNPDESGLIVSGTVTMDTATGKVLSADVTASHVLDDGSFTEYVFN
jgi:hypothetical protein